MKLNTQDMWAQAADLTFGEIQDVVRTMENVGQDRVYQIRKTKIAAAASPGTRADLFKADVTRAINKAIAKLDKGTVGISADCLWQMTHIVSTHGPQGSGAAAAARRVFDQIITSGPYAKLVYL